MSATDIPSESLIGRTLSHFRIDAKLGEGGMGVVYRATDETLGREVALKVLPDSHAGDDERRRRFLREARSAAAVTHPNIATVYEVGEIDGKVFIAMELIAGGTLREHMAPGLAYDESCRIAKEIAKGLARAHDKGVVHRDLKPENVMVTPEGEVKILDFGLAKVATNEAAGTDAATAATQMTIEGRVMGTPSYMSPEQAEGLSSIDARSDVFSLGTMLYEMLSGVRPFDGPTNLAILYAVSHRDAVPLESIAPNVPPEVAAVVAQCLKKRPSERFASAREVLAAIGGEASMRSFDSIAQRAPAAQKLSTVSGLGTALGATIASDAAHPGPGAPGRAARTKPRRLGRAAAIALALGAFVLAGIGATVWVRRAPPSTNAASASASSTQSPPPRGVAITDHSLPRTAKPAAAAHYASALSRLRIGAIDSLNELEDAVSLDPTLAAAQLRLVLYSPLYMRDVSTSERRSRFTKASELASTLDPRDRAMLPIAEAVAAEPVDLDAAIARSRTASEHDPNDSEYLLLLFLYQSRARRVEPAEETAHRVLAADPLATGVLSLQATMARKRGESAEARTLVARCLEIAPAASSCRLIEAQLDAEMGNCKAELADARELVKREPDNMRPYGVLAQALVATGSRLEAVKTALDQAEARRGETMGKQPTGLSSLWLAMLTGDFATADADAVKLEPTVAASSSERDHADLAMTRILLAEEVGDRAKALQLSADFVRQASGWTEDAPLDVRIKRVYMRHQAGTFTDAEFAAARDHHLDEAFKLRGLVLAMPQNRLRLLTDAKYIETTAEAKAALGQDRLRSLSGSDRGDNALALGRLFFLADRLDEAIPLLTSAAHGCQAIPDSLVLDQAHLRATLDFVHAELLLGQALEAKAEKPGACAAYASVQSRWKDAKPRSVTLDKANERARALGCRSAAPR